MNWVFRVVFVAALAWSGLASACDYPADYVLPKQEQQVVQARDQSKFAFSALLVSSKLVSSKPAFGDSTDRVELRLKIIETIFGTPPKRPVLYYRITTDMGAACDPLEPHVGEVYYFFDANTSAVHNFFDKKSNVHPQFRLDDLPEEKREALEKLLRVKKK